MLKTESGEYRVNDPDDLEAVLRKTLIINGNEFTVYPLNERYAVDREARVYDLKKKNFLKTYFNKHNQSVAVSLSGAGKKRKTVKLSRIVARTFVGRPSRHLDKNHNVLEVNHIDGNRQNNSEINLEWVTGKENVEHAHKNQFHPLDKPVLAKHLFTGEIKFFSSIKECGDYFDIHRATLHKHLSSGNSGKFHKQKYIFKLDDGSIWKQYPTNSIKQIGDPTEVCLVSVKNKKDGSVCFLNGYSNVSRNTDVSVTTIFRHLTKNKYFENDSFLIEKIVKTSEELF